jgi:hypothetical protein
MEINGGARHREVVQLAKRVRVYPAAGRRRGCVCLISAVEKAGLNGLNEGQVVEYEKISNKGKTSAGHLKLQR